MLASVVLKVYRLKVSRLMIKFSQFPPQFPRECKFASGCLYLWR